MKVPVFVPLLLLSIVPPLTAGVRLPFRATEGGENRSSLHYQALVYQQNPLAIFPTQAAATCTVADGMIVSVTVTNGGSGYLYPPNITTSSGGGSGAAFFAELGSGGQITSIRVLSGGKGWSSSSPPALAIEAPLSIATAVWSNSTTNPMTMNDVVPTSMPLDIGAGKLTLPDTFANTYPGPFRVRLWTAPGAGGPFNPLPTDVPLRPVPFAWRADQGLAAGGRNFSFNGHGLGEQCVTTGASIAIGQGARAMGDANTRSVALGFRTFAGPDAIALGYESAATGNVLVSTTPFSSSEAAIALGHTSSASGDGAVAAGFGATASGSRARAFGRNTLAQGDDSVAFGLGTIAHSFGEIVFGAYNASYPPASTTAWSGNDRVLVIGNGTSDGARSNALELRKDGRLGINTVPAGRLHVASSSDATASLFEYLATSSANEVLRPLRLRSGDSASTTPRGYISFQHGDATDGVITAGEITFPYDPNSWNNPIRFNLGGALRMQIEATQVIITGTLSQGSDVHSKNLLGAIDSSSTLDALVALPLNHWTYRDDPAETPHLGPMAQDFHAAFATGSNATSIASLDRDGVTLAALRALLENRDRRASRIRRNREIIDERLRQLSELEARVSELETLSSSQP
jgi:hypothetical protein